MLRINEGYIEITISNNYEDSPSQKRGTGTGLLNVSRRLELYYGNKAMMKSTKENGMYTVSLYIPADYL